MSILDGIKTLDEALACLFQVKHSQYAVFVKDGNVYCEPKDIGIPKNGWKTVEEWAALFAAYYAERDKPKWVEPEWTHQQIIGGGAGVESFYALPGSGKEIAEIASTNARRYLTALIEVNHAQGDYEIWYDTGTGEYHVAFQKNCALVVGALPRMTEAAAQHIIDHHSELLRALMPGVGK